MSSLHAALAKLGFGMSCGLVARLEGQSPENVENAIHQVADTLPVLQRRVAWIGSRPLLVTADRTCRNDARPFENLSELGANDGPLWRYRVEQHNNDVWLSAAWAHAAADGVSLLRFLKAVASRLTDRAPPSIPPRTRERSVRRAFLPWLLRFVAEQHLRYVGRGEEDQGSPGIVWVNVPQAQAVDVHTRGLSECGSFVAWLAAAVSVAYCEQRGVSSGRVLVNLPILRDDLRHLNGFGFGIGSLLIPVHLRACDSIHMIARKIAERLKYMIDRRWDDNFDRFLSPSPDRHLRFASLHARRAAPIITISWKGTHFDLGGQDNIRDICCFSTSPPIHISGHIDNNGLSLSLTSRQSEAKREDLLQRLMNKLGADSPDWLLRSEGHRVELI
jgi:hypothetical protein